MAVRACSLFARTPMPALVNTMARAVKAHAAKRSLFTCAFAPTTRLAHPHHLGKRAPVWPHAARPPVPCLHIPKRAFHATSPRRVGPIVGRIIAFTVGRVVSFMAKYTPHWLQSWAKNPYVWMLIVGSGGSALGMHHMVVNPVTGRRQLFLIPEDIVGELSDETEAEYLEQFREYLVPKSNRQFKMAQRILTRLNKNPAVRHLSFRLYYVNADVVNAFVLPNGAVFLFKGLVDLLEGDEDSLACVLAHEVCHVVARHGQERLNHEFVLNWAEVGLQFLLGLIGFPFTGQALFMPVSAFMDSAIMAPHNQANEYEADELGMYMASEACYNPRAAPLVWHRFRQVFGDGERGYLDTHPAHADREKNLDRLLDDVLMSSAPDHCGGHRWPSMRDLVNAAMKVVGASSESSIVRKG